MAVRDIVQAAAGVGGDDKLYIEDVFSTYLYQNTNTSSQTITNGIDLAGEGGLVWIKWRNLAASHALTDTERGAGEKLLYTDLTDGENAYSQVGVSSFNSDGFVAGVTYNQGSYLSASWTFRKAPKFFDVVTYTGTGSARTVSHNLGSVPGCIIIKRLNGTSDWQVYHRANTANPETDYLVLNSTAATVDSNTRWNDTLPTDSVFTVGTEATVNASGGTYVAYLFAHDAGGFGDDGEQNVISCGSYTGNASANGPEINLGYEPQWLLIKNASAGGTRWVLLDSMRGITGSTGTQLLEPNTSNAEFSDAIVRLTATGFKIVNGDTNVNGSGSTMVYVAIRRGPMKTPTSGTEVFAPVQFSGTYSGSATSPISSGFAPDAGFDAQTDGTHNTGARARLLGQQVLITNATNAEATDSAYKWDGTAGQAYTSSYPNSPIFWMLRRAPGFFDVVCYTGTSTAGRSLPHNLQVTPELIIFKRRNFALGWYVYHQYDTTKYLLLNDSAAEASFQIVSAVSSTDVTLPADGSTNASGSTYVAYLFATLAGVSKVGSYTGTGTTLQVNCGFSAGARFVMIKRTDSTGDWYVWDSARGIVAGNDPYLLLNSTAAEVTSTDHIDPLASGFEISSTAPAAINASGGNFIFLAIA